MPACQNPDLARATTTSGNDRAVEEALRERPGGTGAPDGVAPGAGSRSGGERAGIESPRDLPADTGSVRAAIGFMEEFRKTHDLGGESLVSLIREGRR